VANTFRCTIVTPAESLYEGSVTYANFPAWDGQQGMMAGQSPLLTRLGVGSLRLDLPEGGNAWFFLDGGFAQVQGDSLTLLTEGAVSGDDLSSGDVDAELAEIRDRVTNDAAAKEQAQRDKQSAMGKKHLLASMAGRS